VVFFTQLFLFYEDILHSDQASCVNRIFPQQFIQSPPPAEKSSQTDIRDENNCKNNIFSCKNGAYAVQYFVASKRASQWDD